MRVGEAEGQEVGGLGEGRGAAFVGLQETKEVKLGLWQD